MNSHARPGGGGPGRSSGPALAARCGSRAQRHKAQQQVERWRERAVRELWVAAQAPLRQIETDVNTTLAALDDETRARRELVQRVEGLLSRLRVVEIAAVTHGQTDRDPSALLLPLARAPGQLPGALLRPGDSSSTPARLPLPVLSSDQARSQGFAIPVSSTLRALLTEARTILQDR